MAKMPYYATVAYDERCSPSRKKWVIRKMKAMIYLQFPLTIFKKVNISVKDHAPTAFDYGYIVVKVLEGKQWNTSL